jgi:hypothetical protein
VNVWYWNAEGKLLMGQVFAIDIAEARRCARIWFKDERGPCAWITLKADFFDGVERFAVEEPVTVASVPGVAKRIKPQCGFVSKDVWNDPPEHFICSNAATLAVKIEDISTGKVLETRHVCERHRNHGLMVQVGQRSSVVSHD